MKTKSLFSFIVFLVLGLMVSPQLVKAQSIIGFWEVKEVRVGEELMTPVAKWFRINKDHTYQAGNGWLQNATGTWTYDKKSNTFLPRENNGVVDEAGAFKVHVGNETMQWEREEEGEKVVVTLKKSSQMPMSTADQLTGLWNLNKATKDGQIITASLDPDSKHYIFIRWDRIFVERTPQGERSSGFWHIDGHRPELTLINHSRKKETERWQVSVEGSELIMVGISDSNKGRELVYKRIDAFPK
jgi:hypothetical protein